MWLDVRETDRLKTLVVQPVKPEDLPVIQTLIESDVCTNASLAFVRNKENALRGFVYLDVIETTVDCKCYLGGQKHLFYFIEAFFVFYFTCGMRKLLKQ